MEEREGTLKMVGNRSGGLVQLSGITFKIGFKALIGEIANRKE